MRCDDRQPPDKRLPPLVNKVAGDADHVGQELGWGKGRDQAVRKPGGGTLFRKW